MMKRGFGGMISAGLVVVVGGCDVVLGLERASAIAPDAGVGASSTASAPNSASTSTASSTSSTGSTGGGGAGGGGGEGGMSPCAISPLIHVSTLAGTGVPGFVEGDGTAAQFSAPEGITVDMSGTLYVADAANARVRKVLANGFTSTFAGPAGFLSPRRIALHSDGNFYMVDPTNDNLQQITPAGVASPVFYLGGIVSLGISPAGSIYVADTQTCTIVSVNGAVSKFFSGSDCGFQDGTAASAKYSSISDIAFDDMGNMYVADTANYRVRKLASDGSAITLAGSVQGHADGVGASARFAGPTGLTVDNQQHIVYVADGTTIRAVAADGTVTTVVGSKAGLVDGDGCAARFGALQGITYFAGALYAVDINRIRKVTLP